MAPPLSRQKRLLIVELREGGHTISEISRRTGITRKTIIFWVRRNEKTRGDLSTRPRQLIRRATTAEQDAAIVEAHNSDPFRSTRITATQYSVSTDTIRRRLKAVGLKTSTPAKKMSLTAAHAQDRSRVMNKSEVMEPEEMNSSEENIEKNKSKICEKKRKRIASDSSTDGDDALPKNALEVERNVHASAIKNNLDETSVKKILKSRVMDKSEVIESEEMNSSEENIAKNKSKVYGKKQKRIESDSSTDGDDALPENALEVERNVHASAIKNNLDETSVNKILKSRVMDKSEVMESEEMNSSEENILKIKSKICGRKRKRIESDSSTDGDDALPENALEVERNVHASAIKNNLDETSVKKILKKVVTNDHVLALVKLREEDEDSATEASLRPKITRAKAKQLRIPCLKLTPIKHIPVKTRPEVEALIAQELPDDEDDEEYEPTPDDVMSDDDHIIESCSDLNPRTRTPSTPRQNETDTSKILKDELSEVPQEISSELQKKLESELEEEATIALRTRSKLSLSETPIEHIESSFDPPDYLPVPDVDDLWNDFLKECLNPASNARNEDDDEADPEYSVAADPDANEEDEEALENSIIQISKKELSDLVTELFHIMPEGTDDQVDDIQAVLDESNNTKGKTVLEGKQEPLSDGESKGQGNAAQIPSDRRDSTRYSIGKTEQDDNDENKHTNIIDNSVNGEITNKQCSSTSKESEASKNATATPALKATGAHKVTLSADERAEPPPPAPPPPALRERLHAQPLTVNIQVDQAVEMYPQQVQILQQQLRQHIQLAVSNFMQLFLHPLHWSFAPQFKEYLVSLNNMTLKYPNSVVDVCNLKPAMDLVESWESSLSENTPEAIAMIEFFEKELETCRRRITQHNTYIGDFPDMFKNVVANSSVFLYPYLLPPMAYKSEYHHKRNSFLRSEDELIVLGLDQFWWYVDNNPQLFNRPARLHPRQRWGLATVTRLISKHMLPFLSPRSLLAHVHVAKKKGPKDSAIVQYFKNNRIEPVKHKLLPYNPKVTLYEQPEFEIPRLWVKYLAKNSKRFRDHMRHPPVQQPAGVEIDLSKTIESVERPPLPIDFTKTISCNRINMHPVNPSPELVDKVDVHIQNCEENRTTSTTILVASNIYTLVNTSKGAQLIPLQAETSTVNSASTPIFTPAIVNSIVTQNIINPEVVDTTSNNVNEEDKTSILNTDTESIGNDDGHCKCCKLFKKIRRKRQTFITEYFNGNKKNKNETCDCRGKKYPRITNKLRLLVNNYKTLSKTVYNEVLAKLDKYKNGNKCNMDDKRSHDFDFKDLVSAVMFQIKLVERANKIRNTSIKVHVHNTFAKFDVENGDPLELTESLLKVFDVDLAEMYKEFMSFLTAEQADKINNFKDYFIRSCIPELIAKIEEHILDDVKRQRILQCITEIILNNSAQACEICCKLLNCSNDYPVLAQYIYSLFPHRWREKVDTCSNSDINKKDHVDSKESALKLCDKAEAIVAANYEADNSSSDEEATELRENVSSHCSSNERQANNRDEKQNQFKTTIKYEQPDESEMVIDESIHSSREPSDDGMSMIMMSDDESLKVELPDWKREEDKLILEVLKQCISPEEMKDKTLIEIIENKNIVNMLADSLSHKSLDDVRGRMLYLLEILVDDNIH